MNGIDKIIARIEADAIAEAEKTTREAQEKAAALREEYNLQAQDRYRQVFRLGLAETEERLRRLEKTADMEAKKNILVFKQEVVASVFDAAEARILNFSDDEYLAFLTEKALRAITDGTEEIILNAADKHKYADRLLQALRAAFAAEGKPESFSVAGQPGDFRAGLIIRRGSVYINCTLDSFLSRARSELAAEVAEALFS